MCATTRSSVLGRSARCGPTATTDWCWRSPSRGSTARPGTNPGLPCASPASLACAGTSRQPRPITSRRCRRCWIEARRSLDYRHPDLVDVDRLAFVGEVGVDGDGAAGARPVAPQLDVEEIFAALVADRVALAAAVAELAEIAADRDFRLRTVLGPG